MSDVQQTTPTETSAPERAGYYKTADHFRKMDMGTAHFYATTLAPMVHNIPLVGAAVDGIQKALGMGMTIKAATGHEIPVFKNLADGFERVGRHFDEKGVDHTLSSTVKYGAKTISEGSTSMYHQVADVASAARQAVKEADGFPDKMEAAAKILAGDRNKKGGMSLGKGTTTNISEA